MDSLFIIQGNDQGKRYTLDSSVISIGRDPSNKIHLHDPETSRKHAKIVIRGLERFLMDLESSNGVFINGRQIQQKLLINGDRIQIGKTILLYVSGKVDVGVQGSTIFQEVDVLRKSCILHSHGPEDIFKSPIRNDIKITWLKKASIHFNFMYHATLVASQTLNVERLLDRILELIFQWAPVDRGCIFLYDVEADKLVPKSSRTRKEGGQVRVSQTILNYAFRKLKAVLTTNVSNDERWGDAISVIESGVKEAICVPMQGRYGLVGVIYIDVSRQPTDVQPEATVDYSSFKVPRNLYRKQDTSLESFVQTARTDPFRVTRPFSKENYEQSLTEGSQFNSTFEKEQDYFEILSNENANKSSKLLNVSNIDIISANSKNKKLSIDHLKLMIVIGRQSALAIEDTQYHQGMAQRERLAAIGQAVTVLSHHIKNILQGIRGGSFLIRTGLKEHDENLIGKGWNIVEKNQAKISDLVFDMLAFSRERIPVWTFSNFNEVIIDVIELMRGRALELDTELEFYPTTKVPNFYFDKEQMHRAIVNLIENALEASKSYPHTHTHVQTTRVPEMRMKDSRQVTKFSRGRVEATLNFDPILKGVFVIVDDVGLGIPSEIRDNLFRPFTSKNKSGGTGLGLAVAYKVIREHKGKITIADSPLGGTRFIVELPLLLEKPLEE